MQPPSPNSLPGPRPAPSALARHWTLDPAAVYLNHGSFGACPEPVLRAQERWRRRLERQPVQFFVQQYPALLEQAAATLADFLGADAADLALVPNATCGVNTVLRSLRLQPGDELLTTDHQYNACGNALDFVAHRAGARVVQAAVPFPLQDSRQVEQALLARVTRRTRLALVDHVTSPTALVWPVERIVSRLAEQGVQTLVDGAHAPGMLPLALDRLGAAYYTGNCHKWLCAPKGAGFLHVRRDGQQRLHPLAISHGHHGPTGRHSRFQLEFGWTGTLDPSPYLCVPDALEFIERLLPGGWPAVQAHNHQLCVQARDLLCQALGLEPPCPEQLLGSMASLPLPDGEHHGPLAPGQLDPLQLALWEQHGVELPVAPWPATPRRLLRVSAQLYNSVEQYEYLARTLRQLIPRGGGSTT